MKQVTLPSGLEVKLELPHLYHMLSQVSIMPNPYVTHLVQHLGKGGSDYEDEIRSSIDYILMLYELFALCVKEPKISLENPNSPVFERKEGTLYQDDIHVDDLLSVYHWFRRGTTIFFASVEDK